MALFTYYEISLPVRVRDLPLVGNDEDLRQAFVNKTTGGKLFPNLSELNMIDLTCGFVYILS